MAVLKGLKPEKVFAYFEKLCSVPHGSGNTKIISDLCVSFAEELGLKYRQEPCNNVVIWKPASPGCESAEPIILQGHIDMVCAKTDDCTKDMTREGLDLMTDGEWIWADKTSLGGDNCIAVAMILAILSDDTLVHPPIEAVFTVDEEVGMDGAFALDCSDLKGKKLLNLDSELEGVFTVSCAGGMRSDCLLPAELTDAAGTEGFGITVAGLQGGHSGADIHLGRGSANRLMGRVLAAALEKFPGLRLAAISGGQFDNVICARCDAVVALPTGSGAATDLGVAAVLLIALLEGTQTGSIFALLAGTVYFFSGSAPGAYCVALLTIPAMLCGLFRQKFWRRSTGSMILCSAIAMLIYEVGLYGVALFLGRTRFDRLPFFLLTALYSIAVMIPLYQLIYRIGSIGGHVWNE